MAKRINYIDKALLKAAKDAYSLASVEKFFDIYGEEYYKIGIWDDPKKLEQHYHIWMIVNAGFTAGINATLTSLHGVT